MPKKSLQDILLALKGEIDKRRVLWALFQRHPDFIHFCRTRFPEARRAELELELDSGLPPALRESLDEYILRSFLETRRGEALARKYGLWPLKSAVQVIPHQRARDIKDLRPQGLHERLALYLRQGRFLHLKIDCTESLTQLNAEIALQIKRYRPLVAAKAEPGQPCKPYTKGKWLYLELDLVDLHMESVSKTLAEAQRKVKDKRRGISLSLEDMVFYDRVQSGEALRAIGGEAPLFDPKDPDADPQEARRQKARRAYRKIKKMLKR